MAIYLEYNKGSIKGDVTQDKHTSWIAIDSFQWGVGRGISGGVGNQKNREASEASVSEVTITKQLDASSALLCQEDLVTQKGVPVIIDFVRTGPKGDDVYLKFTLTNTLVSGYSISSGGDRPSESITLNFTKIEYSNTPMKDDGAPDTPTKITYDVALAKIV